MGNLNRELTIVKLGGSLITHKDRPLAPNAQAIALAAKEIAKSLRHGNSQRIFLVHGGGSFGHYYAAKFHLSTTQKKVSNDGVSRTAAAMITLHSIVLDRLVNEGVPCKTILTSEFLSPEGKEVTDKGARILENLFQNKFVPISFGNVSITQKGSLIISGDRIALSLARKLRAKSVIFAMDVDGIYPNSDLEGKIIDELRPTKLSLGKKGKYDVTGGIGAKIEVGFRLARVGAKVFYVNGTKEHRLSSLIAGNESVKSTKIYSKSISTQ